MREFPMRMASPPPLAVTRRPRDPRDIRQVQWHATRGRVAMDRQLAATEAWFANPANDQGGWGASADFVVGPDYRLGGEVAIVYFGDTLRTFSSWSAGYGAAGTLPAAPYGFAIEVAQPAGRDWRTGAWSDDPRALYEEFTEETVEACAFLVRRLNAALAREGLEPIPPVWIGEWDQDPNKPVPRGHIGHDTLANGRRLGKSDPGPLFPLARIFELLQEPPVPTAAEVLEAWHVSVEEQRGRIAELTARLGGS